MTAEAWHAGSTFMLPRKSISSSIHSSIPEEMDIIDPYAMSNTPSPSGVTQQPAPLVVRACKQRCVTVARGHDSCYLSHRTGLVQPMVLPGGRLGSDLWLTSAWCAANHAAY